MATKAQATGCGLRAAARRGASLALAAAALLLGARASAAPISAAALTPVGAKIDRVRVFSQYARVYRKSWVRLKQADTETRFALVDLPEAARRHSLRVESKSASAHVVRVETQRVRPMLPRQKRTRELIKRLEVLLEKQRALGDRRRMLKRQLSFIDGLGVADIDALARKRRFVPVGLHVRAWQRILEWTDQRAKALRKQLLELTETRRTLRRELHKLRVEGKELQREVLRRTALRVFVTLRGAVGKHGLLLSYLVSDARWLPSYDLRYLPQARAVKATYYAVVKQQSGEDWTSARLRFSTGRALQMLRVPELKTWTIGRKRDFHPKPHPRLERVPYRWRAPPPPRPPDLLLRRLQRLAGKPRVTHRTRVAAHAHSYWGMRNRRDLRRASARYLAAVERMLVQRMRSARRRRDIVRLNCIYTKLKRVRQLGRYLQRTSRTSRSYRARQRRSYVIRMAARALREGQSCVGFAAGHLARGRLQTESTGRKADKDADGVADSDDEDDTGKRNAYKKKTKTIAPNKPAPKPELSRADQASAQSPPPPPAPVATARAERLVLNAPAVSGGSFRVRFKSRPKPRESVPWTDAGYRPTALNRDLPAAAAKGYRYTLYAPGTHDVSAGGKERRIPILEQKLKVQPLHRIVAGRSKSAYLIGTLTNTTGRPILRGHANLFTGAAAAGSMFTGRTWVNTSLPGGKLELPLGVDDGVKVSRYTKQKTVIKGLIFKDDVTRYTVTVEVANNHGYAVNAEVVDQVPLVYPHARKVEVKRFTSASGFAKPDKDGRVRWRGKVAPNKRITLTFSFDIVRPKDWRMRQHGG